MGQETSAGFCAAYPNDKDPDVDDANDHKRPADQKLLMYEGHKEPEGEKLDQKPLSRDHAINLSAGVLQEDF